MFGFEHEAAALVEVDAAGGLLAAAVLKRHGPLQHVGILAGVIGGGVGARHAEQVAEILQKQAVVGAFRAA